MRQLLTITVAVLLVLSFGSCKKDLIGPQPTVPINDTAVALPDSGRGAVWVINEGTFLWGNASISVYNPEQAFVQQQLFARKNGISPGDVMQSVAFHNELAYLVVNNSQVIHVVQQKNLQLQTTIGGFNSPRYLLPVSDSKAYVTDLYANAISIVDLETSSITGSIAVSGWTEELLLHNGFVYVLNMESDVLYRIDPATDLIVDSLTVPREPNSLVMDTHDKLWVLCSGGINEATPALIRIDPVSFSIESAYEFELDESPTELELNVARDRLYFLNGGLFAMAIDASNVPLTPVATLAGAAWYGLGIDPLTGDIYVSAAHDFLQSGSVYRYDSQHLPVDTFAAGIAPGAFGFPR